MFDCKICGKKIKASRDLCRHVRKRRTFGGILWIN